MITYKHQGIKLKRRIKMNWNEFEFYCKEIAHEIMYCGKSYNRIIPIVRGGMMPAMLLSELLNVPIRETIFASSYTGKQKGELKFKLDSNEDNVLLVDDICDTGDTLKSISMYYPNSDTAVLVHKPSVSRFTPTYYGMETKDWIIFPWDKDPLV